MSNKPDCDLKSSQSSKRLPTSPRPLGPLPNYTLSTVCPACGHPTYRYACKVRCSCCGFMWDCSEL